MSRSFLGFGQVPYIGQPFTNPIKIRGIGGQSIPLLFNWISYGAGTLKPNINVLVDIDNAVCRALDQIRSIYIDNLGSSNPIYVYFPDTGETLSAKANSEGWYPAFTNARKFWVIGEGFLDGTIPTTYIIATNIPFGNAVNTELDQAVALLRASPVISRGTSIYNSNFGIPALGDQFFSSQVLDITALGATVPLFHSPFSSGFLYITNLIVSFPYAAESSAGTNTVVQIVLESTGVAGILLAPAVVAFVNGNAPLPSLLISGQIKLDATQTWRARTVANCTSGFAQIYAVYTQQP